MISLLRFAFICIVLFFTSNVMAQDNSSSDNPEFGLDLTSEVQATNAGDYNFANVLRLNASIPVVNSLSVEAASLSTYMTAEESIGGDLQVFSNQDAENIPFALSKLDFSWQINEEQSLFLGIRNVNEDYFTSPVTSFFTNSSCGIFPTISANYPVANYPVASVGAHYRYDRKPIKLQASLYNGKGYRRFSGRDNIFRVCPKSDGVFGMVEAAIEKGESRYFLGGAVHYNERVGVSPWFYAEQNIAKNLTLIADYSHAFASDAVCEDFVGVGIHYQLSKCELGLFSDYARFQEANEWATELSCKYSVNNHVDLQPVAHFVVTDSRKLFACCFRVTLSY